MAKYKKITNWPPNEVYKSDLEYALKLYQSQSQKSDIPEEISEIDNFFEEF